MFLKIIATIILIIEIINPNLFWKIREQSSIEKPVQNKDYHLVTRILSVIALMVIWIFI